MGRPAAGGRVFYLGRVRWVPADGDDLLALLEMIAQAEPGRKAGIVKAALAGGMARGRAAAVEMDADTSAALDEALSGL